MPEGAHFENPERSSLTVERLNEDRRNAELRLIAEGARFDKTGTLTLNERQLDEIGEGIEIGRVIHEDDPDFYRVKDLIKDTQFLMRKLTTLGPEEKEWYKPLNYDREYVVENKEAVLEDLSDLKARLGSEIEGFGAADDPNKLWMQSILADLERLSEMAGASQVYLEVKDDEDAKDGKLWDSVIVNRLRRSLGNLEVRLREWEGGKMRYFQHELYPDKYDERGYHRR